MIAALLAASTVPLLAPTVESASVCSSASFGLATHAGTLSPGLEQYFLGLEDWGGGSAEGHLVYFWLAATGFVDWRVAGDNGAPIDGLQGKSLVATGVFISPIDRPCFIIQSAAPYTVAYEMGMMAAP